VVALCIVLLLPYPSVAGDDEPGRHRLFSQVLRTYVQDGLVDYDGIEGDAGFSEYLDMLARIDPASLADRNEQLAFWINAYNAYTIKLIIDEKPESSIRDISLGLPVVFGPWSISFATVGGKDYTLNAIEHDIIRAEFGDPRVHFALVCASRSCPKLRPEAYEGPTLDHQLDEEARGFINDPALNRFDVKEGTIFLSKIFDWYSSDFDEKAGSLRVFLSRYVASEAARDLLWSDDVEIDFLPYDWSLNRKNG